jgi:hypothetical protein
MATWLIFENMAISLPDQFAGSMRPSGAAYG